MARKLEYEVLTPDGWKKAKRASAESNGWLHYQLYDGTIGVTLLDEWRIAPAKDEKETPVLVGQEQ